MKLKGKILLLILLPILVVGAVTYVISSIEVTDAMKDKIQLSLKAGAILLEDDLITGQGNQRFQVRGGSLYYGTKNITEDRDMVNALKEETDIVATVFFGDTRYMSSITDESGNQIIGTQASETVIETVLNGGNEYFAENVNIEGTKYFAFYRPLYDSSSGDPVGMIFLGMNQEEVEEQINVILLIILAVIVVIAIACMILAIFIVNRLSGRIVRGVKVIENVSNGDLTVSIDTNDKKAKDEIGAMTNAIDTLKTNLYNIVNGIIQNSTTVYEFANTLSTSMQEVATTVNQVETAVTEIADGATSQADETQTATENVIIMGNVIKETGDVVISFNDNANEMSKSSKEAGEILKSLEDINTKTKSSIEEIYAQTNTTNRAALKISEATALISSIADETNLLSLNASIEAARAGEAGRGFAVVADQIQKLAEQSTVSAKQIDEIVGELINDSERAVETMDDVKIIVNEQNAKIDMTGKMFEQVRDGIDSSVASIKLIGEKMRTLNGEREKVVDIVQSLSSIAEENAASTEETSASVTEVTAVINDISGRSEELGKIAQKLTDSVSIFKI